MFEHELVSFLGFCGYYRKFIKNFSDIVKPLEEICRKKSNNSPVHWNNQAIKSFEKLKLIMSNPPVLAFPEKEGLFILDTDASDVGTGAVLSQLQNGQEKVIS